MVAIFVPELVGVNLILKLVLVYGATGEKGWTVTLKAEASAPPICTLGELKSMFPVPVFSMVKVTVLLEPTFKFPKL